MKDMEYPRKITVIGAGVSGKALAIKASLKGYEVFVSELKENIPEETLKEFDRHHIPVELGGHTDRAWQSELVLISSGISPSSDAVTHAREKGIPVMGEIDFVSPWLKGKVVGVTGSNGKTTTASMIGHVLRKKGFQVAVAGNIGNPVSLVAGEDLDYLVLELSSFQLFWTELLRLDVAVVTNLAPDHIDWHGNYARYVASKSRICGLRKDDSWAIVQAKDISVLGMAQRDKVLSLTWDKDLYDSSSAGLWMDQREKASFISMAGKRKKLMDFSEVPLLGTHNLENAAMALASVKLLGMEELELSSSLSDFVVPPHRCEFVARAKGVTYVDDSKGTNVAASRSALLSISGKKIVILGGQGKGEDYFPLAEAVRDNADAAILLGEEADAIAISLKEAGFSRFFHVADMEEAVLLSARLARPGMTVLLSPACTSWDMYPSYKVRGEHFQDLVKKLSGSVQDSSE